MKNNWGNNMERIYHHYELWEDHKLGFWKLDDDNKEENIKKSYDLLTNTKELKKYMVKVIKTWKYSCEQNLSNTAMNRQAYLGQAASCIKDGVPANTTRRAWNLLTEEEMNKANGVADIVIKMWEAKYENK
jgi:hypothetical protein